VTTTSGYRAAIDLRLVSGSARAALLAAIGWLRREALSITVVVFATGVYCLRSLRGQLQYQTNSFDLGIFAQGVKGYAHGTGPISEIKGPGFSLLGDHFSPITALLAPVYWIVPSVVVLLVAQAFLIALAAAPLVSWARRALGAWPAVAVGFVYTASFGVASAIAFDFHEVAFAAPLLSFSLCALGQGRHRAAAAWALPLVLVKEDLGVTVAAIGAILFIRRSRRLGAAVAAFGLAATALEVKVLIPMVNGSGQYDYSGQASNFSLSAVVHQPGDVTNLKIATILTTLSVGVFLGTRSTLALAVVPTLLWRMIGSNYAYWTTGYQYSLVLMPILVAALVDVLARSRRERGPASRSFVRWALIASTVVTALLALTFPVGTMLRAGFWVPNPRLGVEQAAVALVPANTTVAATSQLVPQLTDRSTVTLFTGASLQGDRPQWIIADMQSGWPDSPDQRKQNVHDAMQSGYRSVFDQGDVVVLEKVGNR